MKTVDYHRRRFF